MNPRPSPGPLPWLLPWLLLCLLLVGVHGAAAQTVLGTVRDADGITPIPGAWVVLLGPDGSETSATLADAQGGFAVAAPGPGAYRLLVRVVGFQDSTSDPVTLDEGRTVRLDVTLARRPIRLAGISVEAAKQCGEIPPQGSVLEDLWTEARTALQVVEWAGSAGAYRFFVTEHLRQLDAGSLRVVARENQVRRGFYDRSPYVSLSADSLARFGYVQPAPDGSGEWDFWAPDGDVLLSDSFLDTHCFWLEADAEAGRVGLRFAPVEDRELPDVEGVLWLGDETAELDRLEFRYVHLPFPAGEWDDVGGQVNFERLSNGIWIVRDWRIRMPLDAERGSGGEDDIVLLSIIERGATVSRVETIGGETVAEAEGATLHGVVTDGSAPVPAAEVTLGPAGPTVLADADGRFRMTGLPSGTYEVVVAHPWLDAVGSGAIGRQVTLEAGSSSPLAVDLALKDALPPLCASRGLPFSGRSLILGFVQDTRTGDRLPGLPIEVTAPGGWTFLAESGPDGEFAICAPASGLLTVRALAVGMQVGAASARTGIVAPDGDTAVRFDFSIDGLALETGVPDEQMTSRGFRWSSGLRGSVTDEATGLPIPGAVVTARTASGVVALSSLTDAAGQFFMPHGGTAPEPYDLAVSHIAFAPAERRLEVHPTDQLVVEVALVRR